MKRDSIAIIGAGGFAREVLDIIAAVNLQTNAWNFVGFVADDEPNEAILGRIDAKWLGTVASFLGAPSASHYVIGIGDCSTRRSIARKCDEVGLKATTLCHPSATLGEDVVLGSGTIVCSHVSITTNVRIGDHAHVNLNSTIGHDCSIGNFVTINPLVAVSGDVTLEDGVTMGTHSSVLQGLRVAKGAFVGAGAVVVRDVAPGTTVVGIPARPLQTKPGN